MSFGIGGGILIIERKGKVAKAGQRKTDERGRVRK